MQNPLRRLIAFGDITHESRIVIWLLIVGFVLELLKMLARHG